MSAPDSSPSSRPEPPLELIPPYRPALGKDELDAVGRVFESRWLGTGSVTRRFQEELQQLLGARHVIALNTGTAALHMALASLDLRPGDEVITPSMTFVSTVQAILAVGARPVFCEVRAETATMDVSDALARAGRRTRVILPVHYGGAACDMDPLLDAARDGGFRIVEDAAHAFGSRYGGRPIGSIGDITCFSFDPIKNITCGTGGAIATDDERIASRIRIASNVGMDREPWERRDERQSWFYQVVAEGHRYRMSDLNAAIGLAQLRRLDEFRTRKLSIVRRYDEAFRDLNHLALLERDLEQTFPFTYAVRVLDGRRDLFIERLRERGVGTAVHFIPNHLQPAFADFRHPLPTTERLYSELVNLPLYVEMSDDDVGAVIDAVRSFFPAGD